jgi:transposase
MKPYSLDLRERVLAAVDDDRQTRGEIALRFSVSPAWIRRLVQRRRQTGSIAPLPRRSGPLPKLRDGQLDRLRELIAQKADATLAELRASLGEPVGISTLWRAVQKLRLPLKKSPSGPRNSRART